MPRARRCVCAIEYPCTFCQGRAKLAWRGKAGCIAAVSIRALRATVPSIRTRVCFARIAWYSACSYLHGSERMRAITECSRASLVTYNVIRTQIAFVCLERHRHRHVCIYTYTTIEANFPLLKPRPKIWAIFRPQNRGHFLNHKNQIPTMKNMDTLACCSAPLELKAVQI